MIDTRTMAVVVGALSLAFGVGAVMASSGALGLAAGVIGSLAGLMACVGISHRTPVVPADGPSGTDHRLPDDDVGHVRSDDPGGHGDATDKVAPPRRGPAHPDPIGTAPTQRPPAGRAGHFDLTHGSPSGNADPDTPSEPSASAGESAGDGPPLVFDTGATEVSTTGAEPREATAPDGPTEPKRATAPLTDPLTGLFSEDYFMVALESRLASARRHLRPVALAVMEVNQGLPDEGTRRGDPSVVANAVRATVRDSDIACRLGDGTFGVILEDTPENGAVWTVERIRRNLVSSSGHHTLWAGVACYPAHAFTTEELVSQVTDALGAAREWNQDRIEVALPE